MEKAAVVDNGKNRHGFPRGYHFAPHDDELMRLLDLRLDGRRPLPHPLPNIFRESVRICDSHPADLYEEHKEHAEAGHIYFFDHREYPTRGRKPKRKLATRDGGHWKASGGKKEMHSGGAAVGYKLTMVFYEKEEPCKTDWALHEYTRIDGNPNDKKVKSLALYRLYKKAGRADDQAIVAASTSPQAHHQDDHGAAAGPSNWVTPAAPVNPHAGGCMGQTGSPTWPRQEAVNHFGYAAGACWDNTPLPSLPPPPVSAFALDLPVSGPPPPLPPLPAPGADGYLADEFKGWCETRKQDDPLAASSCSWLPMPYDDLPPLPPLPAPAAGGYLTDEFKATQDEPRPCSSWLPMPYDDLLPDLPMLMDESELYSCTLEELLLAPITQDDLLFDRPVPDAYQDDMAAPATTSTPDGQPGRHGGTSDDVYARRHQV